MARNQPFPAHYERVHRKQALRLCDRGPHKQRLRLHGRDHQKQDPRLRGHDPHDLYPPPYDQTRRAYGRAKYPLNTSQGLTEDTGLH